MNRYYTIGMAGHIDHGKTTLTKALTGVDTDRLKDEKKRNISIELGYAPFIHEKDLQVSIVDVPGHERFIRQMVAGVAGIDMVVLVIAADEGVMPQTKEHLHILSYLGIEHGLIALTKIDQTDEEMLELVFDDVRENIQHTFLESKDIYSVDSFSGKGLSQLKDGIKKELSQMTKKRDTMSFRLPIDQVFTVKGQGTVIRGTIYNGQVNQEDRLRLLPLDKEVRVRQIQVHRKRVQAAFAGQRTAINIGGVANDEVTRGDVLVKDDHYSVSSTLDIVFRPLRDMKYVLKQRQTVKLHIGTSEVMGKIVFFDRNEVPSGETDDILCQLRLDEKVVTTRGDRFLIRRPTPVETMGGGWVIDPNGKRYPFGQATINKLALKKEGTPKTRIRSVLQVNHVLSHKELLKKASVEERDLEEVKAELLEVQQSLYTLSDSYEKTKKDLIEVVDAFHNQFPMRVGIDKAKLVSELKEKYPLPLIEYTLTSLINENRIKQIEQYVASANATPRLPEQWKKRLENVAVELERQGLQVDRWRELTKNQQIPLDIGEEFFHYLLQTGRALVLNDDMVVTTKAIEEAYIQLKNDTNGEPFTIQEAKASLDISRKYLVPLLELFDRLHYTKRIANTREWL